MKILQKLDHYLLSDISEEITYGDRFTVYGFYVATLGVALFLAGNLYF